MSLLGRDHDDAGVVGHGKFGDSVVEGERHGELVGSSGADVEGPNLDLGDWSAADLVDDEHGYVDVGRCRSKK